MKRIFSIFLICLSAFATDVSPTLNEAVKSYTQLHKMTPAPHSVSSEFIADCIDVSSDPAKYGPHIKSVGGTISIYMNDPAQKAFLTVSKSYPVGSVIIKEKSSNGTKSSEPDLGGMIKRKHSEKPNVDDWEFFYRESGKKPSNESMQSCKDCHANAANKDFVFGNWLKLSLPKEVKVTP